LNAHKKKGADAGKKNNKLKRAVVGVLMVACLFIPIYAGPVYHTINSYMFVALCYNEMV
jgi:hypothetical protein